MYVSKCPMPTGELRKYSKGDNEIEGTIISTELVVDPKYNVYQQLKNTLIWPLLVTQYASTGVKDEDEQFKMDIVKAKVKHPSSLYNVLKEVDIIK